MDLHARAEPSRGEGARAFERPSAVGTPRGAEPAPRRAHDRPGSPATAPPLPWASLALAWVLALFACEGADAPTDPGAPAWTPPPFECLPESADPPDPFVLFSTGERVTDAEGWTDHRAPELRTLFAHYVYGYAPEPAPVTATEREARPALDGAADLVEVDVGVGGVTVQVALFLPASVPGPHPPLVALNKCGNHTVTDDPDVPLPLGAPDPACGADATEEGRGSHASEWPLAEALADGWAVATFAQSDIDVDDPDDESRAGGVRAAFAPDVPEEHAWGTIAAWAWGISRVIDALEQRTDIDRERIVALGHSRRGKAALWAAANDPRISGVWAHQSGIVGAALERGSIGETVAAINTFYPHWFAAQFHSFGGAEALLPVDQHLLLALLAPRPVVVTDGEDDTWANPPGAEQAVALAQPVYALLEAEEGALTWQLRDGEHEMRASDWAALDAFLAD